jgi:hypothetical protein
MIHFTATIKQFKEQGEKTGWTYIEIPATLAQQLKPGNKKAFRVKGKLDNYQFSRLSMIPMGGGDFILALNATIRKEIKKNKGATVQVVMAVDTNEIKPPVELIECLEDEPKALTQFKTIPKSHQNYFINWINSAKTDQTKAKRIAQTINALAKGWNFGEMLRAQKKDRLDLTD